MAVGVVVSQRSATVMPVATFRVVTGAYSSSTSGR
jgi:hypothetical protein